MNKPRELFLLFKPADLMTTWLNSDKRKIIISNGYTLVYAHKFMNDEPPYIMITYWGTANDYTICKEVYPEEGETISFYLIRSKDAQKLINCNNESQNEYCSYYIEGILTRNAGEHNQSPMEYADYNNRPIMDREPKVKRIYDYPNTIQLPIIM